MEYTSTRRQAQFDKLNTIYDQLLEMDNTDNLITEIEIQLEVIDLDESMDQMINAKSTKSITRDVYEITMSALRFKKQSLIDQLTSLVKQRQAIASLKIG